MIHCAILLLRQFERYEPEDGKIAERELGQYLLVYADLPKARRNKMLKRVKKKFSEDQQVGFLYIVSIKCFK